jgi:hypothetical protein
MELVSISGQLEHRSNAAGRTAPAANDRDGFSDAGRDLFCLFLREYDRFWKQLGEAIAVG